MERTDTSKWINNAALNGTNSAGPGVIVPGVKICFQDYWKYYIAAGQRPYHEYQQTPYEMVGTWFPGVWATYRWNVDTVLHGASQTNLDYLTLETRITETNSFYWAILGNRDALYEIRRSTNFQTWDTVQTFTNTFGLMLFMETNMLPNAVYQAVKVE